jgi:hypothetical protein
VTFPKFVRRLRRLAGHLQPLASRTFCLSPDADCLTRNLSRLPWRSAALSTSMDVVAMASASAHVACCVNHVASSPAAMASATHLVANQAAAMPFNRPAIPFERAQMSFGSLGVARTRAHTPYAGRYVGDSLASVTSYFAHEANQSPRVAVVRLTPASEQLRRRA